MSFVRSSKSQLWCSFGRECRLLGRLVLRDVYVHVMWRVGSSLFKRFPRSESIVVVVMFALSSLGLLHGTRLAILPCAGECLDDLCTGHKNDPWCPIPSYSRPSCPGLQERRSQEAVIPGGRLARCSHQEGTEGVLWNLYAPA